MSKLKGVYASLESHLNEGFNSSFSVSKSSCRNESSAFDSDINNLHEGFNVSTESDKVNVRSKSISTDLVNKKFGVKAPICNAFGKKHKDDESEIGGHPDFKHLKTPGELENGFVVSLFLDIQGSTKLGVTYDPEMVYFIKNTIISCAIETIQAFGGHVHRIMGDAVLAFFRTDKMARNSAINAINCGTYIVEFMKSVIKPRLAENGIEKDVGIRIGIDYGSSDRVLWGMYGYTNNSEVTATSFFVDVAAKLQQQAPRNRVLLGQSLKELLDLPMQILEFKKVSVNGVDTPKTYVEPNYTDAEGKKINYKQFVLKHENYLALLPGDHNLDSRFKIKAVLKKEGKPATSDYFPCSEVIKTSLGIEFKVIFELEIESEDVIEVKFRVENTGEEAKQSGENYSNHETKVTPKKQSDGMFKAKHFEETTFLGLHFMHISVIDSFGETLIPEKTFSLYVGDPLLEIN